MFLRAETSLHADVDKPKIEVKNGLTLLNTCFEKIDASTRVYSTHALAIFCIED